MLILCQWTVYNSVASGLLPLFYLFGQNAYILAVQVSPPNWANWTRHKWRPSLPWRHISFFILSLWLQVCFPGSSAGKESACNAGDLGSVPELGRSSGRGHGNLLLYSCMGNPHGQRSLVGYSPQNHKDSDTTERLTPRAQRAVRSPLGSCTASSSCETFEKDVLWEIQSFSNKLKCFLTAFALLWFL